MAFAFSYNNLYAGYSATPPAGIWYDFKTFMKTNGFKVIASGDGVSQVFVDMAGVNGDCITSGGTGAGGLSNSYAWFVLQEASAYAGVKRQWLFWKSNQSNNSLNGGPMYSWQGFLPNASYTDGSIDSVVSNTVTFSAAEVATLNVVAGMTISISGSSNASNNGVFLVASVTGTSLTYVNASATTGTGLTWTVFTGHQNAVVSSTNPPLGFDELCLADWTKAPRVLYNNTPASGGPTISVLFENGSTGNYYAHFAVSTSAPNAWYILTTHGGASPVSNNLIGYDPLTNYDSANPDPTYQITNWNVAGYSIQVKLGMSRYNAFNIISKADGLLNTNNVYFGSYGSHLQYWNNASTSEQGWMYGNDWCCPTVICNSVYGANQNPINTIARSINGTYGTQYTQYAGISSLFVSNMPIRAFGNLITYNSQTYMPYNSLALICNGTFPLS
jgi:hypothetical protein